MDYLAKAPRLPRDADYPTLGPSASNIAHGEAYYLAAKKLWKAINGSRDVPHPDSLVFPLLFLLHHFLELELKEVIRATFSIGSLIGAADLKPPRTNTHDLKVLLSDVDCNLEVLGLLNASPFSQKSRDFMVDLEEFSPKSEALRYPFDKAGKPTLPPYYRVNMPKIMEIVDKTREEFGGALGYLLDREDTEIVIRSLDG